MKPQRRRRLVIAVALVTLFLTVVATALVTALAPPSATGLVYTVRQVELGLRAHPAVWAGRTVQVRGVLVGVGIANIWRGNILADADGWMAHWSKGSVAPLVRPARPTALGSSLWQFDGPGSLPVLILQGKAHPAPDAPLQALRYVATYVLPSVLSRLPVFGQFMAPPPDSSRIYQVRLLSPGRCPTALAGPCLRGVIIS